MNYSVTLRRVISLDSFSCASNGGSIFLDVVADGVREARIFNCSNRVSNKTTGWREKKGERENIKKKIWRAKRSNRGCFPMHDALLLVHR